MSIERELCVASASDGQVDCLVGTVVDMMDHGTTRILNGRQGNIGVRDKFVHDTLRDIGQDNIAGEVVATKIAADIHQPRWVIPYVDRNLS